MFDEFERVRFELMGGTSNRLFSDDPTYDGRPVWNVWFEANDEWTLGSPVARLNAYVDMATGEIVFVSNRRFGVDTEGVGEMPELVRLDQNYPNPFNPATVIPFTLSNGGRVSVQVFDVNGRLVETILDEWRPAGEQRVEWSASGMASGVYLYRLQSEGSVQMRRMVLLR